MRKSTRQPRAVAGGGGGGPDVLVKEEEPQVRQPRRRPRRQSGGSSSSDIPVKDEEDLKVPLRRLSPIDDTRMPFVEDLPGGNFEANDLVVFKWTKEQEGDNCFYPALFVSSDDSGAILRHELGGQTSEHEVQSLYKYTFPFDIPHDDTPVYFITELSKQFTSRKRASLVGRTGNVCQLNLNDTVISTMTPAVERRVSNTEFYERQLLLWIQRQKQLFKHIDDLYVDESNVTGGGLGLFTKSQIPAYAVLCPYFGRAYSDAETQKRGFVSGYHLTVQNNPDVARVVGKTSRLHIDPFDMFHPYTLARFANATTEKLAVPNAEYHSMKAGQLPLVVIRTTRAMVPGEEILIGNYGREFMSQDGIEVYPTWLSALACIVYNVSLHSRARLADIARKSFPRMWNLSDTFDNIRFSILQQYCRESRERVSKISPRLAYILIIMAESMGPGRLKEIEFNESLIPSIVDIFVSFIREERSISINSPAAKVLRIVSPGLFAAFNFFYHELEFFELNEIEPLLRNWPSRAECESPQELILCAARLLQTLGHPVVSTIANLPTSPTSFKYVNDSDSRLFECLVFQDLRWSSPKRLHFWEKFKMLSHELERYTRDGDISTYNQRRNALYTTLLLPTSLVQTLELSKPIALPPDIDTALCKYRTQMHSNIGFYSRMQTQLVVERKMNLCTKSIKYFFLEDETLAVALDSHSRILQWYSSHRSAQPPPQLRFLARELDYVIRPVIECPRAETSTYRHLYYACFNLVVLELGLDFMRDDHMCYTEFDMPLIIRTLHRLITLEK